MKPARPSRFTANSKSKDFFPIKQYRFDTTNHPIITSRKECKFRLKTILSVQEEQQLTGLINSLQCTQREAIRIAFYEAVRRGSKWVETVLKYALRDSKERGHTSRCKTLTVALPNAEKQALLELGKELDLSEKEIVRLAIIWLAYGIKYEAITRIHKCQRLAFDKIAQQWSRENQGKPPNPQVSKLKESRDIEKEICILLGEGVDIDFTSSAFKNVWKTLCYGKEEERYQDYALKYGYSLANTNAWERQILGIMLLYRFTYKQAVNDYYYDKREADKIIHMSRSDFLELLIKNKQDSIDREKDHQKRFKEDQEQKRKDYSEGKNTDYATYFKQTREQRYIEDEEIVKEFFETKTPAPTKTDNFEEDLSNLSEEIDRLMKIDSFEDDAEYIDEDELLSEDW